MHTFILSINSKSQYFTHAVFTLLLLLVGFLSYAPVVKAAVDPTGYLRYQVWQSNTCKENCFSSNTIPILGDSADMKFDGLTNRPDINEIMASKATNNQDHTIDIRYSGTITISKADTYAFSFTNTRDTARIYVNKQLVTEITQSTLDTKTSTINLKAGTYPFEIWFHSYNYARLKVTYRGADTGSADQCIICSQTDLPSAISAAPSELPYYQGMDFTGDQLLQGVLYYKSYQKNFSAQMDFAENRSSNDFQPDQIPLLKEGYTSSPSAMNIAVLSGLRNEEHVIAIFYGYLEVSTGGTYTFDFLEVNDVTGLYIDGYPVFINNFQAGQLSWLYDYNIITGSDSFRSNSIKLTPGIHKIVIPYYNEYYYGNISVNYSGPDTGNVMEPFISQRASSEGKPVINSRIFTRQDETLNPTDAQLILIDPINKKNCTADAVRRHATFAYYPNYPKREKKSSIVLSNEILNAGQVPSSAKYDDSTYTYGLISGLNYTDTASSGGSQYKTDFGGLFSAIDRTKTDYITLRLTWHQNIKQSGTYNFNIDLADDYVWIIIDGVPQLYANYGISSSYTAEKSIELSQGSHRFEILYGNYTGEQKMAVSWKGPDTNDKQQHLLFNENAFSDRLCDPIDPSKSTFIAPPTNVLADGTDTANLVATLKTSNGQQITWSSEKVRFTILSDPNTKNSAIMYGITNQMNGEYKTTISNTEAEAIQTEAWLIRNKRVRTGKDSTLVFSNGADIPDTETVKIGGSPQTTVFTTNLKVAPFSGYVYQDNNFNGRFDSDNGEKGIASTTVVLYHQDKKSCSSTKTNANGHYQFAKVIEGSYIIYEAANEVVPVPNQCDPSFATDPYGYLSTTPNKSGILTIPDDSEFDFGNTPIIGNSGSFTFVPSNNSTVTAGNSEAYWHQLTVPSAGTIDLSIQLEGASNWYNALLLDENCDGVIQDEEFTPIQRLDATHVPKDNTFCLVHYVTVPNQAIDGEMQLATIIANFSFRDGKTELSPLQQSVTNAITVKVPNTATAGTGKLVLRKYVKNMTKGTPETQTINQAEPSDKLQYRIEYTNQGNANIIEFVINDVIPEYTILVDKEPKCLSPAKTELENCTFFHEGNYISWKFSAGLTPAATNSVIYTVQVE